MKTKDTLNSKRKRNKIIDLLIIVFVLVGTYFIAKPFVYQYLNERKAQDVAALVQKNKQKNIAAKRSKLAKSKDTYNGRDVKAITKEAYQNSNPDKILFKYGIGEIRFVERKQVVPVMEGVTEQALLVGAGTLKPDQEPGKGNFALIGHAMGTKESPILFSMVASLKSGEHVKLTVGKKAATYKITKKKVISPYDMIWMQDSQGNGLITLFSCTADSQHRWMVRGKLVN